MPPKSKFYSLAVVDRVAELYIFGDITSWPYYDNDVSSFTLSRELQGLEADQINVHVNSYGGEVGEGLAIYNMLRNHAAKIKTICEGFACSISSAIFMAGDERVMNEASFLMIHNAWMYTAGNADQLRKAADDLDILSQGAKTAYMSRVNITEEELQALLDGETWLTPADAVKMGFATSTISADSAGEDKAAASARKSFFAKFTAAVVPQASPAPAIETQATLNPPVAATEPAAPVKDKTPLKFFSALLGGKEQE